MEGGAGGEERGAGVILVMIKSLWKGVQGGGNKGKPGVKRRGAGAEEKVAWGGQGSGWQSQREARGKGGGAGEEMQGQITSLISSCLRERCKVAAMKGR